MAHYSVCKYTHTHTHTLTLTLTFTFTHSYLKVRAYVLSKHSREPLSTGPGDLLHPNIFMWRWRPIYEALLSVT